MLAGFGGYLMRVLGVAAICALRLADARFSAPKSLRMHALKWWDYRKSEFSPAWEHRPQRQPKGQPKRQWNDRHRCELWAIRRFGRQHQSILQCEHRFWERPGFSGELLWADRRLIDWGRTVRIRGRWVCDAALAKIDRIRRLVELGLKAKAK
jgi:hypothetical protein